MSNKWKGFCWTFGKRGLMMGWYDKTQELALHCSLGTKTGLYLQVGLDIWLYHIRLNLF